MSDSILAKLYLLVCAVWATVVGRLTSAPLEPSWTARLEVMVRMLQLRNERSVAAARAAGALEPGEGERARRTAAVRASAVAKRKAMDDTASLYPLPEGALETPTTVGGRPAAWLVAPNVGDSRRICLFLHGGGFIYGGVTTHRRLAARVGEAARARVLLPEYRLAPEHTHEEARADALAAYRHVLSGWPARNVVVAGDSAGANLALRVVLEAREAGLPMPAAVLLLSPWVDLGCGSASLERNAGTDFLARELLVCNAHAYAGRDAQLDDPRVSPLRAEFPGDFPRTLVQVGGAETLLDEAVALRKRIGSAKLETYDGEPHDFQFFDRGVSRHADEAVHSAGAFCQRHAGDE